MNRRLPEDFLREISQIRDERGNPTSPYLQPGMHQRDYREDPMWVLETLFTPQIPNRQHLDNYTRTLQEMNDHHPLTSGHIYPTWFRCEFTRTCGWDKCATPQHALWVSKTRAKQQWDLECNKPCGCRYHRGQEHVSMCECMEMHLPTCPVNHQLYK